jgi:hypothetical protein
MQQMNIAENNDQTKVNDEEDEGSDYFKSKRPSRQKNYTMWDVMALHNSYKSRVDDEFTK